MIKHLPKELEFHPSLIPHIKKYFCRYSKSEEEYCYTIIYLGRFGNEDSVIQSLISSIPSFDQGPGRAFANTPCVRKSKSHIMIRQVSGIDI